MNSFLNGIHDSDWPGNQVIYADDIHLRKNSVIERFSFECRKSKTKVISLTNHNIRKESNELIRARSKYMSPVPSAGKRVRVSHDWF